MLYPCRINYSLTARTLVVNSAFTILLWQACGSYAYWKTSYTGTLVAGVDVRGQVRVHIQGWRALCLAVLDNSIHRERSFGDQSSTRHCRVVAALREYENLPVSSSGPKILSALTHLPHHIPKTANFSCPINL